MWCLHCARAVTALLAGTRSTCKGGRVLWPYDSFQDSRRSVVRHKCVLVTHWLTMASRMAGAASCVTNACWHCVG